MISLEFLETGKAKVVGIFENYALKMNKCLLNQKNFLDDDESEDSEEKAENPKEQ